MRKVCIVITTRGNYAKMKSVLEAIEKKSSLQLQLVVGGGAILPRYGSTIDHLNNFPIAEQIHFLIEGENLSTMAKSTGLAIIEFTTVFGNLEPDVVIVIADRFEAMSVAIAASYMNIPLAHLEGGEVSGSIDESIRHAITKLSHLHFPATKAARERIKHLGEPEDSIFIVGNPSLDVIKGLGLSNRSILAEIQKDRGVGALLDFEKEYIVVIQHPVTTEYEQNLSHINETTKAIDKLKIPAVWIWPNMDAGSDGISKGIRLYREHKNPSFIHFFKSLPIEYFGVLLNNASCIVGNSSAGIREAAFLGVPSVNIGTRQDGRERGKNVIDVDYDATHIEETIVKQIKHGPYEQDSLYGDGTAGEKIADVLSWYDFKIQKKITY